LNDANLAKDGEISTVLRIPADAPALRILLNSEKWCVFLHGNHCKIYEARPEACRDFPHVAVGKHSLGSRQSSLA
jgi:Fe-S-cluster containining protein